MKKYELTEETLDLGGAVLHRIRRVSDGVLGGWVESEKNLSQSGTCWVSSDGCVYGDAWVSGNAHVYGRVYGDAHVYGRVSGNARVS